MTAGAFFDLDRTVLTINSGSVWMKRDYKEGRLSLRHLGHAMVALAQYGVGALDVEGAMEKWLRLTRAGTTEAEEQQRAERWWTEYLAPTVSARAVEAMNEHRRRGDVLVLATSSTVYQAEIVARELGFDHVLASRWVVKDGKFTGDLVKPICYGEGKLAQVRALCRAQGIELESSTAYTDSITDRPLLEAVGQPRPVNPDRKLRALAAERGWTSLDWNAAPVPA